MRPAALVIVALLLNSCEQKVPPPTVSTTSATHPVPYQRFVPSSRLPENVTGVPWSGAFALDTKTGKLCLTYEGDFGETWNGLPKCIDLLKAFPD